jgi:amidase
MDTVELAYAGIARQAQLIADGEISSRELLETYLDRIARLNPRLNAFRIVFAERARLEAGQADARRGAGGDSGRRPLLGVPIAVKDDIDVAGELTTHGTNAQDEPARADAEVVRRLREAGAVIIGKTNVPELTMWPFTETATFGATRNPWDLQRAPGGSSGGSAAAVAAGLVGAALGSDGAGSIRIPAAWCGLFGLKPQRGRVSMAPHARGWYGLSVKGVLARTVADTALFHDVASGAIDVDADSAPAPEVSFSTSAATRPEPLRIAYSTAVPPGAIAKLDADARKAFDETVELLRSLGHQLTERDPNYGAGAIPALTVRYLRGIHDAAGLAHPERLERRTRAMARMGGLIPPALLERSLAAEAQFARRLNGVLEDNDVLLTPATAAPPPRIGRLQGRGALWTLNTVAGWVPYNGVWNVTGQPAASVPAGFGVDGLPRAVQLVGRINDEATLLSLAGQLEAERPWAQLRPPEFS